ncbi:MAG: GTP-binding protein [Planctomycetes bacterium]|nr:GTP-binding protein [Planctomycetota bacterium]
MAPTEPSSEARSFSEDATASVLTPVGRGAVGVVSVQGGPHAASAIGRCFRAVSGLSVHELPVGKVCFGHWGEATTGTEDEEVVVVRRDSRRTEVCCHGGVAAMERILSDLGQQGIRRVAWQGQFASVATGLEAELQCLLSRATTRRAALRLLQLQRTLPAEIARLTTSAEAILSESASSTDAATAKLIADLDACLKWESFGLHLTEPWRIVLAGRPNVGKSTLLNALAGFRRAIVYDEPGTTRDVVSTETALDGWPVCLLDTAGIRDATGEIEREGVSRSRRSLEEADCVCLLLDASSPMTDEDDQLLAEVEASDTPSILVASKSDLGCVWESSPGGTLAVSAMTDAGIDDLIVELVAQLVPDEPPAESAFPASQRQVELLAAAREAGRSGEVAAMLAQLQELISGWPCSGSQDARR